MTEEIEESGPFFDLQDRKGLLIIRECNLLSLERSRPGLMKTSRIIETAVSLDENSTPIQTPRMPFRGPEELYARQFRKIDPS